MIQQQGQIDPRMADKYIKSVVKRMEDDPASLSLPEKRLIERHSAHKQKAAQIQRDLDSINSQITQAQARAKSLELQLQGEAAKADNCMEILLSLKFEPDVTAPQKPKGPAAKPGKSYKPGGNGKEPSKEEKSEAAAPEEAPPAEAAEENAAPVPEEPQAEVQAQA
jgi:hypothetical protein